MILVYGLKKQDVLLIDGMTEGHSSHVKMGCGSKGVTYNGHFDVGNYFEPENFGA